jgi:hypothetical protein
MHRRRLTGVVYEVYRRRGHWASWIQLTLNRMGSDVRREVRTVRMNVMLGYSKPQRPPACDVTIPSTSPRGGRSGTAGAMTTRSPRGEWTGWFTHTMPTPSPTTSPVTWTSLANRDSASSADDLKGFVGRGLRRFGALKATICVCTTVSAMMASHACWRCRIRFVSSQSDAGCTAPCTSYRQPLTWERS